MNNFMQRVSNDEETQQGIPWQYTIVLLLIATITFFVILATKRCLSSTPAQLSSLRRIEPVYRSGLVQMEKLGEYAISLSSTVSGKINNFPPIKEFRRDTSLLLYGPTTKMKRESFLFFAFSLAITYVLFVHLEFEFTIPLVYRNIHLFLRFIYHMGLSSILMLSCVCMTWKFRSLTINIVHAACLITLHIDASYRMLSFLATFYYVMCVCFGVPPFVEVAHSVSKRTVGLISTHIFRRIVRPIESCVIFILTLSVARDFSSLSLAVVSFVHAHIESSYTELFIEALSSRANGPKEAADKVFTTWADFKKSNIASSFNGAVCCLISYGMFGDVRKKSGTYGMVLRTFKTTGEQMMDEASCSVEYLLKCLVYCSTSVYDAVSTGKWEQLFLKDDELHEIEQEYALLEASKALVFERSNGALASRFGIDSAESWVAKCKRLISQINVRMEKESYPAVVHTLARMTSSLMTWLSDFENFSDSIGLQIKPLVVTLLGRSHIGKSEASEEVVTAVLAAMGIQRRTGDLWDVPTWSKYDDRLDRAHVAFRIDDAMNSKNENGKENGFGARLISMVNNVVAMAVSAEVEKKGKIPLSFKAGVITSNMSPAVLTSESNAPVSNANRLGIVAELSVKKEFRDGNGVDWEKVIRKQFVASHHLEVRIHRMKIVKVEGINESVTWARDKEPMSWENFLRYVGKAAERHNANQSVMLDKFANKRTLVFCKHHKYITECKECMLKKPCIYSECDCGKEKLDDECKNFSVSNSGLGLIPFSSSAISSFVLLDARGISLVVAAASIAYSYSLSTLVVTALIALIVFAVWYVRYCITRFFRVNFGTRGTPQGELDTNLRAIKELCRTESCPTFGQMLFYACVFYVAKWLWAWYNQSKVYSARANGVYADNDRVPVATEKEVAKYESLPRTWKSIFSLPGLSQASSTTTFENLVGSIASRSLVVLRIENKHVLGLAIKSQFVLVTTHSLRAFPGIINAEVVLLTEDEGKESVVKCVIDPDCDVVKHPVKDVCIIRLNSLPPRRDIIKHFASRHAGQLNEGKVVVCPNIVYANAPLSTHVEDVAFHEWITVRSEVPAGGPPVLHEGWKYKSDFQGVNQCGAPLICRSRNPYIVGIHVAEMVSGYKCIVPVDKEDLASLLIQFDGFVANSGTSVRESLLAVSRNLNVPVSLKDGIHEQHAINKVPNRISGILVNGHSLGGYHMRSRVRRFKLADKVKEITGVEEKHGKPLGFKSYRTFDKNLTDILSVPGDLDPVIYKQARDDIWYYYMDVLEGSADNLKKHGHTVPLHVATSGVDGISHFKAMNMSSSAGFPLNKNKANFFDISKVEGHCYSYEREPSDKIKQLVAHYVQELSEGRRINTISRMKTKDEPTKQKTRTNDVNMKVRPYYCEEVSFGIVCRMYLLGLLRAIYMSVDYFEHCHAINCYSPEWDDLYNHLNSNSDKVMAGDFSRFDMCYSPQITHIFADFIIAAAIASGNYSEKDVRVIRGLLTELLFPLVEYNGILIFCSALNVSGNLLTVELNNHANRFLHRYAFFYSSQKAGVPRVPFRSACNLICYGDDNIVAVKPRFEYFNMITMYEAMQSIGVQYTDTDKNVPQQKYYSLLNEAEFLKRTFVKSSLNGQIVGPLAKSSFSKMLYQYVDHKGAQTTEEEVLMDSIAAYLSELWLHDSNSFNTQRNSFVAFAKAEGFSDQIRKLPQSQQLEARITTRFFVGPIEANPSTQSSPAELVSVANAGEDLKTPTVAIETNEESSSAGATVMRPYEGPANTSIKQYLMRPVLIRRYSWSEAPLFDSINPWKALLEEPAIARKVANFAYIKGEIEITVLGAGNFTRSGRLVFAWNPVPHSQDINTEATFLQDGTWRYSGPGGCAPQNACAQRVWLHLPHIMIDPSISVNQTMQIPFVWPNNYFTLHGNKSYLGAGDILVFDYVPYRITQQGDATVRTPMEISLMARFTDVELFGSTSLAETETMAAESASGVTTVASGTSDSHSQRSLRWTANGPEPLRSSMATVPEETAAAHDKKPVSKFLSTVAGVLKLAGNFPAIQSFTTPLEMVANCGAQIAGYLGYSRPLADAPELYMPTTVSCGATVDGQSTAISLGLYARGEQQSVGHGRYGGSSERDDLNLDTWCARESHIFAVVISPTLAPGVTIWGHPVGPISYQYESAQLSFYTTALTQTASLFKYWQGMLVYRFRFVLSATQRLTVKITFDPRTPDSSGAVFHEVATLVVNAAETPEVIFRIPWQSDRNFLEVRRVTKTSPVTSNVPGTFDNVLFDTATDMGYIKMEVVNGLTNPGEPVDAQCMISTWMEDPHFLQPDSREVGSWIFTGPGGGVENEGTWLANSGGPLVSADRSGFAAIVAAVFFSLAVMILLVAAALLDCLEILERATHRLVRLVFHEQSEASANLLVEAEAVANSGNILIDDSRKIEFTVPGPKFNSAALYAQHVNEPIVSLRPLLKRRVLADVVEEVPISSGGFTHPVYPFYRGIGAKPGEGIISDGSTVKHHGFTSIFHVLCSQHKFRSGSMRWTIVPEVERVNIADDFNFVYLVNLNASESVGHSGNVFDRGANPHNVSINSLLPLLPSGFSGMTVVDTAINGTTEVSMPAYSRLAFFRANDPGNGGVNDPHFSVIPLMGSQRTSDSAFQRKWFMFSAVGDDFSLGWYRGPQPFVKGSI